MVHWNYGHIYHRMYVDVEMIVIYILLIQKDFINVLFSREKIGDLIFAHFGTPKIEKETERQREREIHSNSVDRTVE